MPVPRERVSSAVVSTFAFGCLCSCPFMGKPHGKKTNCSGKTCYCVVILGTQGERVVMSGRKLHYLILRSWKLLSVPGDNNSSHNPVSP